MDTNGATEDGVRKHGFLRTEIGAAISCDPKRMDYSCRCDASSHQNVNLLAVGPSPLPGKTANPNMPASQRFQAFFVSSFFLFSESCWESDVFSVIFPALNHLLSQTLGFGIKDTWCHGQACTDKRMK